VRSGLAKSKGEARRLIAGGGVYVNDAREADPQRIVGTIDLRPDATLLVRTGKKTFRLVRAE
jgi:tyrosyl-tRNA synthetase